MIERPAYVITTCGKSKMPHAARADEFYRGNFVKDQGRTAASLKPRKGRLVLSNKYGFMRPDFVIPGPYDSHWGYPDTMPDEQLRAQVAALDLRPGDYVVNLGAREYAWQTRRLFPKYVRVIRPAECLTDARMGHQKGQFTRLRLLGRVPARCMSECELPYEGLV